MSMDPPDSSSTAAAAVPSSPEGAAVIEPSASYSIVLRVRLPQRPGAFGQVATAIGETGGILGAIDLVRVEKGMKLRDVTVSCVDAAHGEQVADAVRAVEGVTVESVLDRTFQMHRGGKIEVNATVPVKTRDDLSMAYTPGVARVCTAIHEDPEQAWALTIKGNTVAVVSDGTAVLGLGDIGPEAAMPVMEGKALLFKEFAGVDAFPLCVATTDVDEIVAFVKHAAPTFGGVNLEDIAAPRCFEIERRLREELDVPVFHDDQHGTAIVTLAALLNALRVVGKRPEDIKVVVTGAGAAGVACTDIILAQGARNVIVCDRRGALYEGRDNLDAARVGLAARTNPGGERGTADELLAGADVYLGLSGPGAVSPAAVRSMAPGAIVFAMANPTPEVRPEEVRDDVTIMATGRSDYPNQINNVLAARTNPGGERGTADQLLAGADVYLGLSGPGAVSPAAVRSMAPGAIVFAMANPTPEVRPEEVRDHVTIMATGRSDYPNQINNVLAFPGVFRGALDVRATTINEEMKLAAAQAIADVIPDDELDPEYIIPSAFNRDVAPAVARRVAEAAMASGIARRPLRAEGVDATHAHVTSAQPST